MTMNIKTPQGRRLDVVDVSTLSLRDMYEQLCKNRDFEIALVWQRAIFLTAFLIGCFTAYGSVASMLFGKRAWNPTSETNTICFLITLVGIVISLLWIMMAKGSKAWYELYECAIKAFVVKYSALCNPELVPVAQNEWRSLIDGVSANNASIRESKSSRWPFSSSKGGAYSVSRINIFIGQFAFGIWFLLALGHVGVAGMLSAKTNSEPMQRLFLALTNPIWMLAILGFIVVGACLYGFFFLKSGYLSDK